MNPHQAGFFMEKIKAKPHLTLTGVPTEGCVGSVVMGLHINVCWDGKGGQRVNLPLPQLVMFLVQLEKIFQRRYLILH
ncbi:hypothetical protein GCM10009132_42320 [Serratia ureilytica]